MPCSPDLDGGREASRIMRVYCDRCRDEASSSIGGHGRIAAQLSCTHQGQHGSDVDPALLLRSPHRHKHRIVCIEFTAKFFWNQLQEGQLTSKNRSFAFLPCIKMAEVSASDPSAATPVVHKALLWLSRQKRRQPSGQRKSHQALLTAVLQTEDSQRSGFVLSSREDTRVCIDRLVITVHEIAQLGHVSAVCVQGAFRKLESQLRSGSSARKAHWSQCRAVSRCVTDF